MTAPQVEIQLIAVVVAVACALPGAFLVLRRMAMMSDAISHAILFGIVLAFFVTRDLASPFLVVAAALTGVLTVSLVELLNRTGLVREDAAIGLVFPALFSVGVILMPAYAGKRAPRHRRGPAGRAGLRALRPLVVMGYDLGPRALYLMACILLLNVLFIAVFYKELKLATFDAGLAAVLGFSPGFLHYGLMALVSVTAVGAFDAVGSILVVALMIAPPATAYLLVDRLSLMLAAERAAGGRERRRRLLGRPCPGRLHRRLHGVRGRSSVRRGVPGRSRPGPGRHRAATRPAALGVRPGDARRPPVQPRGPSGGGPGEPHSEPSTST